MLPDFPRSKQVIRRRHQQRFHRTHNTVLGPFTDISQSPVHEGHRVGIIREDGVLDEIRWKTIRAEETIKLDEVQNWTDEQIYAHYDSMATQMAFQQKKLFYEEINEATKNIGNEVSLNGPPSGEGLLKVYETMWMDFREDGKHEQLTLVCSPESQPQFEKAYQELLTNPQLRRRFEELIHRKKEEWREREAARKLVG